MFIIIGLMLTGMLSGYLLRRKNLCKIRNVIIVLIRALLLIPGVEVGGNEQIIKRLHTIGTEAIILTLNGTLGSAIVAQALWKASYKEKGEVAQKAILS